MVAAADRPQPEEPEPELPPDTKPYIAAEQGIELRERQTEQLAAVMTGLASRCQRCRS